MTYKTRTVIGLPILTEDGHATGEINRKEPGKTITDEEMEAAGQTAEDIQSMLDAGSISEDMDCDVLPEHRPVPPGGISSVGQMVESARSMVELLGDNAPTEIKQLAEMDYQSVSTSEGSKGADNGSR